MYPVHAFIRKTHKYRDGWSHLDNSEFLATVRLTAPKVVRQSESYDEGATYVQYLRVPRNIDAKTLSQALRDTMGGSSCRHEYDCCGCASAFITTKLIAPRKMQVRTSVTYNY